MPLGISVVICAYTLKRWDDLKRAVDSSISQSLPALETIVVIDYNDELFAIAQTQLQGATVLASVHHQGLSGARQTGVDHATGDVIAFLDDDAIAQADWLKELAPAYEDENTLGTGGTITPLWQGTKAEWMPPEFYWVVGCTYAGLQATDGRIRNPIGANMSIRHSVMKRAGPFAPEMGRVEIGKAVYGTAEETEYCIRAAQLFPDGFWAFRPSSVVMHVVTRERTTWAYFIRRCHVEGCAKAMLTQLAGARDGLSAERGYVESVLPRAFARELKRGLLGSPRGFARAGAIFIGLAVTTVGYATTLVGLKARTRSL